MLERPARVGDLTDSNVAKLLGWLTTTRKQSATTANGSHKCLACLWRWARDKGYTPTGPTVAPLKTPVRTPRAWSRDELTRLVTAAATSAGSIGGMPARDWWLIVLSLQWDCGVRAGEMLALRWEWLDWSRGWLTVPAEARKGQHRDVVHGLSVDTMQLLEPHRKATGLILGHDYDRSRYCQRWDELLNRAGLPRDRKNKTQRLRATFASWLTAAGGDATAALGHASRVTTVQHYIDPTLSAKKYADAMPFRIMSLLGDEQQ